jgi:hypothetical protein
MSYQTPVKPAVLKKRVIRGQDTRNLGAPLSVNEVDGQLWATNRYWVTRAERIAPLLTEYNLSADEPGLYAVNGKVSLVDNKVPDISASVRSAFKDYAIPATRVQVAHQDAYALDCYGHLMAVYQLANGMHAGLLADELDWLSNTADAPVPDDCRVSWPVRLMFRVKQLGGGDNVSAAIIADVTRVITPHTYGTDPDTRELVDTPEVSEPGEPVLLAIVMATKYS